jgi:thioredoxin-like negative regulator of GroEL
LNGIGAICREASRYPKRNENKKKRAINEENVIFEQDPHKNSMEKNMNKQKGIGTNIEPLADMLTSKEAAVRQKARKLLAILGKPAVPFLIRVLQNSRKDHVRWEAAKTLSAIGDARAIPSLVKALEDSDTDVAWLAAEALCKFKKTAWPQLLNALVENKPNSVLLQHGAHHVLRNQEEDGFNDLLTTLRDALESGTASVSTPFAASNILRRLEVKS